MPSGSASASRSDAGTNNSASSPESLPVEPSRLAAPRDWKTGARPRRASMEPSGKEQQMYEMDGEWFGDAREMSRGPANKPQPPQPSEPESPAMTLLLSITKASADAIPGLPSSPSGHRSRYRSRDQRYLRSGSVGGYIGGGGGVSNGSRGGSGSAPVNGEFYRLPWYRRPLQSPRPMSTIGMRRNSVLTAVRAGLRPVSGGGIKEDSPVTAPQSNGAVEEKSASPAHSAASSSTDAATAKVRLNSALRQAPADGGYVAAARTTAAATAVTPEPPPDSSVRQRGSLPSAQSTVSQPPADTRVMDLSASMSGTPQAFSMASDRHDSKSVAVDAVASPAVVAGEKREMVVIQYSEEVQKLKAEVDRLKREMATMAAVAAVAGATPSPPGRTSIAGDVGESPRGEPATTPMCAQIPPSWQWTPADNGKPSSTADGNVQHARPASFRTSARALRADDSWMRRRRGSHHRRSSSELAVGSQGDGKGRAGGSVLPTLASDGSTVESPCLGNKITSHHRNNSNKKNSNNKNGEKNSVPVAVGESTPPRRPRRSSIGEGPSPASAEKTDEGRVMICAAAAAAAAAAERLASSCSTSSTGGGGASGSEGAAAAGDGGSSRSNGQSVRPFSVFFPVQDPPEPEALAPAPPAPASPAPTPPDPTPPAPIPPAPAPPATAAPAPVESPGMVPNGKAAAAAAAAAAAVESAVESEVEAAVEATATSKKGEEKASPKNLQVQAAGDTARPRIGSNGSASADRARLPAKATMAGVRGRRRRGSEGEGDVWRWVLVQRTGNQTVWQALISHGLPPLDRRHIWAAWAAVARPETGYAVTKSKLASDPAAKGSITNIIMHDVQRTKIGHPLFGNGGQGLAMLRRVLLRCAELGAVKDAGYIQGMNYLAGFILITFADSVLSERDDSPPFLSSPPTRAHGVAASSSRRSSSSPSASPSDGARRILDAQTAAPHENGVSTAGVTGTGASLGSREKAGSDAEREVELSPAEVEILERECVEVMLGMIALQGGVLSRDLWGLHANTELVEDLLSKHCPDIMEHLRRVNLELIVLTPRWFICIYAGSVASQTVVARIWDLFMWYGRRGPAVLVWVALGMLHGCRRRIFESKSLPAAVKAVRRHAEGCKTFDDLLRQAPVGLNQVVAAWDDQEHNRRIIAQDGAGVVPDRMVAGLVRGMTGEILISPQPMPDVASTPRHHRRSTSGIGAATSAAGGFGIQFPTTPGRPPTPLTSPRSPFPEWAASIFRTSTGGSTIDVEGLALDGANKGDRDRPLSPRDDGGTPSRSRSFRRAASTSWW